MEGVFLGSMSSFGVGFFESRSISDVRAFFYIWLYFAEKRVYEKNLCASLLFCMELSSAMQNSCTESFEISNPVRSAFQHLDPVIESFSWPICNAIFEGV